MHLIPRLLSPPPGLPQMGEEICTSLPGVAQFTASPSLYLLNNSPHPTCLPAGRWLLLLKEKGSNSGLKPMFCWVFGAADLKVGVIHFE